MHERHGHGMGLFQVIAYLVYPKTLGIQRLQDWLAQAKRGKESDQPPRPFQELAEANSKAALLSGSSSETSFADFHVAFHRLNMTCQAPSF